MKTYTVLYRINSIMSPIDAPFAFVCLADEIDHAEDQCLNAYPDADIVWIVQTENYQEALSVYYE